jgi:hypothetical protein
VVMCEDSGSMKATADSSALEWEREWERRWLWRRVVR